MTMGLGVLFLCCLTLPGIRQVTGEESHCEDCQDQDYETIMLSSHHGVRGFSKFAETNIKTFLGIPYALPPTGERRFSRPVPSTWSGVKDAFVLPPLCLQYGGDTESEDCLYLNVFTPNIDDSLPVMVWIHGGGFAVGSGMFWDGTRLASHDVVVVTLNYRLGALGFASTDDEVMPGNFGVLDQILALKWVQKHIQAFGGDPRQVTAFGESAGASSISLHMLSPLSKGLFHKVIMESGSAFNMWGVERAKDIVSIKGATKHIADVVGCSDMHNSKQLLDCLRDVDARAIIKENRHLEEQLKTLIIFKPRVETTFGFLPKLPETLLDEDSTLKYDVMAGFNSDEAGEVIWNTFPDAEGISKFQFEYGLRRSFWCSYHGEFKIIKSYTDFYLKNVEEPKDILSRLYTAGNDLYSMPVLIKLRKYLKNEATKNHVRLFQIDYTPTTLPTPDNVGLPHAHEQPLVWYSDAKTDIFTNAGFSTDFTPDDKNVARKIQKMWTNFAKTGNPMDKDEEEQWPAYTLLRPVMAHIDHKLTIAPFIAYAEKELYWSFIEYISNPETETETPVSYNTYSIVVAAIAGALFLIFAFKRSVYLT